MAWKAEDRHTFMGRIPQRGKAAVVRTLGTGDEKAVPEIAAFLKRLKRYGNFAALDLCANRHVTPFELWTADKQGALNKLVDAKLAELAAAQEPDLDAILADWAEEGGKPRYVKQCRGMIPEGKRYPVSQFSRGNISIFLRRLKTQQPTKNRYRAALMQFAKFLVERELIPHNPVIEVQGFKENPPRVVYYDDATARSVINALEYPYRALEAFMCGTGVEWSAAVRARPTDLNAAKRAILAPGTKNTYRSREVRFLDSWCWDVFMYWACECVTGLPYFALLEHDEALDAHHAAVAAVKAHASTLHDWRHTFAVRERRKGTDIQVIKKQLGHAPNSTMVERTYGAYTPDDSDYERGAGKPALGVAK